MKTRVLKASVVASTSALAIFVAVGVATPALAAEPAAAAAEDTGTITVTARKRSEDILKVPLTVTAMTAETLAQKGVVSMQDVAASTPGININNNSSGHADRSFQQISLRGFTPATTLATTTSMFIDGVAVSSPSAFTAISEPAQIDIVKGPQSAYYGRNTFAGAINVVNKVPTGEWHGSVSGMTGTRQNWRMKGEIEGPIIGDALTFRASLDRFSKNGSWTNAYDGSKLGNQQTTTGTLLIVAKPTDNLTIKAFGMMAEDKDGASAQTRLYARNITATNGSTIAVGQSNCTVNGNPYFCGTLPSLTNAVSANTNITPALRAWLLNPSRRTVSPDEGVQSYGLLRRTRHAHLTADYKINDQLSLSLLGGYNREVWSTLIDLDGFDSSAITSPSFLNSPKGYFDFAYLIERKLSDYSGEARVNYNFGKAHGVVGASYLDAQMYAGQGSGLTSYAASNNGPGGKSTSRTFGAFFGLTYDFTSQFSASVEGRYQTDKMGAYISPYGAQTVTDSTYVPAGVYAAGSKLAEFTYKKFTPRVIANYQITPRTMVYASWAKGVNPSALNTFILSQAANIQQTAKAQGIPIAAQPETVTNYEAGIKGKALDGRLRYTAAAYLAQWRNQVNSITFIIGSGLYSGYANSGAADMYGLEGDAAFKVNDLITVDAAAAYTGTKILAFQNTALTTLTGSTNFYGKEMPNVSKYSANIGVNFGGGLRGVDGGKWFARGDWSFKSGMWSNQANLVKTADLHLFNLRGGVSKGNASLEVFATNVFNNHTYTSISDNWVIDSSLNFAKYNAVMVGLPDLRTVGVQFKVKM